MAPTRAAVLAAFAQQRCSAILRTADRDAVRPALDAAIAGGFRIVEVTMTTPDCLEHVAALSERHGIVVGAGTVLNVDDAKEAMAAGARFLVSPVTDPQVISFCRQHDLVSIPGTLTPTEMMEAHRAGADVVKLFPAPANGPEFIRAVRGPLPFLRIYPTSGVTEDNVESWLAAGAFGVGFVSSLFDADDLRLRRFEAIRARAARMVAKVAAFGRSNPQPSSAVVAVP
ncbi:MAG: bifunctional 4-hydroxy-2-oxoglutarate aldolase/2-dehydro-3-deoxy-phosphogluconate aldolase [Planctomycetes bacterium]|nr:bifunctional 4-hydroxy-2-oxoglutarate aldolase/2-dehydro-3-deoxy-phosphogluconate aldolase [Planctomycetota bacterium]